MQWDADPCLPDGPGGRVDFSNTTQEDIRKHFAQTEHPAKLSPLIEYANKDAGLGHLTTDSAARKEQPIVTGVLDYFPDAIADVARLSKIGNDKHNAGEPLYWSRAKSSDHADCIGRHMIDRGTVDTDGVLHDTKVAWRALAQLQLAIERLRSQGEYQ